MLTASMQAGSVVMEMSVEVVEAAVVDQVAEEMGVVSRLECLLLRR